MPIFEYECPGCGGRTEKIMLSSEKECLPTCRECKVEMQKVLTTANFRGEKDWNRIDIKKGANIHG